MMTRTVLRNGPTAQQLFNGAYIMQHVIIYNIYVVLNYLINNLTLCQLIPLVYHSEKEDAGVFECKSLFICLVLGLFCDVLMIQYHTLR